MFFDIAYEGVGMANFALSSAIFYDVLHTWQNILGECLDCLLVQRVILGAGGQRLEFAQKLEFSCKDSRHLFCLDYVPVYRHWEVFERPKN